MKTLKSITKNKSTVKLVYTNNIYVVLVNGNVIVNSSEFNFVNQVFESYQSLFERK